MLYFAEVLNVFINSLYICQVMFRYG